MKLERRITPISLVEILDYISKNAEGIGSFAIMAYAKRGTMLPGAPGSGEDQIPSLLMFSHEDAEAGADLFEQFIDIHTQGMPHIMAVLAKRQAKRDLERQFLLGADGHEMERGH